MTSVATQAKPAKSLTPALIRAESFEDVGIIGIGLKTYGYRVYSGHRTCKRIIRLFTDNGFGNDTHDVSFHTDRKPVCTCGDWEFRKGPKGENCKHITACIALGLDRTDEEWAADELDAARPWAADEVELV